MKYRQLGRTGWEVSVLGFGASPLGGVFGPIDQNEADAAVRAAMDGGINVFDVAPYYGLTRAESVLGRALRDIPRDRYLLSTKCGRYGDRAFDFSAARVALSIDESLGRLGLDHVDVLLAHDVEFASLDQIVNGTIPAMQRLKQAGKARAIGVSGLPLKALDEVARRTPEGALDVVLSYCHHTLNDDSLRSHLPDFQARGLGVINASPLAMGLLAPQSPPKWHPAPAEVREACREAVAFCEKHGHDIVKLAIQFAVAETGIATTLVGAGSAGQIRANMRYINEPMDEQLLAEVQNILAPVRNVTWTSGLPENN